MHQFTSAKHHHHHHHQRISSRRKSWTKLHGRCVSRITLMWMLLWPIVCVAVWSAEQFRQQQTSFTAFEDGAVAAAVVVVVVVVVAVVVASNTRLGLLRLFRDLRPDLRPFFFLLRLQIHDNFFNFETYRNLTKFFRKKLNPFSGIFLAKLTTYIISKL